MRKALSCRCLSHNGFLTRRGYEAVRPTLWVDKTEVKLYFDTRVSVSGLRRDEDSHGK